MSASVLMISHDLVGPHMAGPGMRYWELAQVLAKQLPVVLAAPEGSSTLRTDAAVSLEVYPRGHAERLRPLVDCAQVVVAPGDALLEFPFLLDVDKYLVMDGYDPHTFESLAWNEGLSLDTRLRTQGERLCVLAMQCGVGDFFICASERQRMLWLGWLEAASRVNPLTYDDDRTLRKLVDVVPTGIPSQPPRRTAPLARGVIPGIGPEDPLLVWGGGIWNWLDPLTLVKAVGKVAEVRPNVRLYFPGPRHPYREFVPDMAMRQAAVQLSEELGLTGRNVFWGDWVAYHERQNYLLEADVGCSLHFETVESYFAFRTRVLDYVWASLPMVVTRGDATSELVEHYGLGILVDYGDVDGVAQAIVQLLSTPRDHLRDRFAQAQQERSWEHNAGPLVRFCQHPYHAPDRHTAREWQSSKHPLSQVIEQGQEVARLRAIVAGYERGRFIRFARWLHRFGRRIRGHR